MGAPERLARTGGSRRAPERRRGRGERDRHPTRGSDREIGGSARWARPIAACWGAVRGKLGQLGADLIERQPYLLDDPIPTAGGGVMTKTQTASERIIEEVT